jgi:hypothetical protein
VYILGVEYPVKEDLRLSLRFKVTIRCNRCNEKFVLRGRKEQGRVVTGFKQCICSNAVDFETEEEALY